MRFETHVPGGDTHTLVSRPKSPPHTIPPGAWRLPLSPSPPLQPSAQSPLVTEKGLENPQSAAARGGAVHSVSETRANTKCGVIGGFLIRGPLCGGAEPAAALPSRGLSAAGGPGRRAPRAPQRIINRASQGPGQRRPFTPPLLPPRPGDIVISKNCSQLGRRETSALWENERPGRRGERELCVRAPSGI